MKLFPNSKWLYADATKMKVLQGSGAMVAEIAKKAKVASGIERGAYSSKLYLADNKTPKVKVQLVYWNGPKIGQPKYPDLAMCKRFMAGIPFPKEAQITTGSDAHYAVLNTDTGAYYECWKMKALSKTGGDFTAGNIGFIPDHTKSDGVIPSPWGATATGLPVVAGNITQEELDNGLILHALVGAFPRPARGFRYPANRHDGSDANKSVVKEGTRFRLPLAEHMGAISNHTRTIALAIRIYGLIIRDMAGSVNIYGDIGLKLDAPGWKIMRDLQIDKWEAVG